MLSNSIQRCFECCSLCTALFIASLSSLNLPCAAGLTHALIPAQSTFDRSRVQELLDSVEAGTNASTLESGYFLRRGQPPLSQGDGYAMVEAAIEKEHIASDRWFVLESVRAFAALRTPGVEPDEAYDAYGKIFNMAAQAKTTFAIDCVRKAVRMYVYSVPGRINFLQLPDDKVTTDLLFQAWNVYYYVLPADESGDNPDWLPAIEWTSSDAQFLPLVQQMIQTSPSNSFSLRKIAVSLSEGSDPSGALKALKACRSMLPSDPDEEAWYFGTVEKLLDQVNDHPSAILAAQDQIATMGTGYGRLAEELFLSEDNIGFQKSISYLDGNTAAAIDVLDAADRLEELAALNEDKNQTARTSAALVLNSFLSSNRPMNEVDRLHAESCLAGIYLAESKFKLAEKTLESALKAPEPTDAQALNYYCSLEQTRKELETAQTAGTVE